MTTELEQEFYDTFEIESEPGYWCKRFDETSIADCNGIKEPSKKCAKCENGYIKYKYYPIITAEKLIQIFLVLNQWYDWRYGVDIEAENVEDFKKEILQKCIDIYNKGWVGYDEVEPKNTGLYEGIQQIFDLCQENEDIEDV